MKKNLRRIIQSVLTVFVMAALVLTALPGDALAAANGPSVDGFAFITLYQATEDGTYYRIFREGTVDNTLLEGAVYDRSSNTLTLTDLDRPDLTMSANMMGDDFTLKVKGSCALAHIYVWGDGYGGSMTVTGTGSLTVNEDKTEEVGIEMCAESTDSRLHFDETVSASVYGSENAVVITQSTCADSDAVITAGTSSAGRVITHSYSMGDYLILNGLQVYDEGDCGYRLICPTDQDGIYAAQNTQHFIEDDSYPLDEFMEEHGYWADYVEINKYLYNDELGVCIPDPDFVTFTLTPAQFENQTQYIFATEGTEYAEVDFYGEDLEEGSYYSGYIIKNPNDTTGDYIYYTGSDLYGEDAGSYDLFEWGRVFWNDETGRYEEDETFVKDPEYLTVEAFEEGGFEYVTQGKKVAFSAADAGIKSCIVGKDGSGNYYAVDYPDIYDYSEDSIINYGGSDFYLLTLNENVDIDDLQPVPNESGSGMASYYHHYLDTTALILTGSDTIDISGCTATLSGTTFTYTGKAIKPSVTVTGLSSSAYTVSYKNNVNVGTATVTITGKGIYTGTITKTFTIKAAPVTMYRLYNPKTKEHLWTKDKNEYNILPSHGWKQEGVAWYAPVSGKPVYRLYNPKTTDHHYTSDVNEVKILTSKYGWKQDNNGKPVFYSGGKVPVYRLYNSKFKVGSHHLTKSKNEYDTLKGYGWKQEGIALYCEK